MGCVSNNPKEKRLSEQFDKFDEQPPDTESLAQEQLPKLSFHSLLRKIKIKKCGKYKTLSLKIQFADYEEFEVKGKLLTNQTAKWEIQHTTQFKATEYQLRKRFFIIKIIDAQNHNIVGSLKINLFLLATGPYHQDFAIHLEKQVSARISFDFKIAQIFKLKLQAMEAQMIPKEKEFPGDRFSFCIRSLIGGHVEESILSYTNVIAFDEDQSLKEIQMVRSLSKKSIKDELKSTKQLKSSQKKSPNKSSPKKLKKLDSFRFKNQVEKHQYVDNKDIFWSKQLSKEMPQIELKVPFYDLQSSCWNIIFYEIQDSTEENEFVAIKSFLSECFISTNKLLNYPCKNILEDQNYITYEIRNAEDVQLKSWNHGKETGLCKFTLKFTIQKHLKQLQVCVRTEKGVLQSSHVLKEQSSNSEIPEQIQQLERLQKSIQTTFIQEASKKYRFSSRSRQEKQKFSKQIRDRILKQISVLETTTKESMMIFNYKDENSLIKGQRVLIDIGFKTKQILDEEQNSQQVNDTCWVMLCCLIKRAEFNLAHMGFSKFKDQFVETKRKQLISNKIHIALDYMELLNFLLEKTLKALETYNYQSQKQFAELFCAFAYFRIPKFRGQILEVITRKDDPDIEEWRGTQYALADNNSVTLHNENQLSAFNLMFDWESHFYRYIEKEERFALNNEELQQVLRESSWQDRMKKRRGAFFSFVRYWVNYVELIAVNPKHVNWKYFPGYNKIVHSFLVEMKFNIISHYSDAMKMAASSLLANQKLLNPFVLIVFKKTNINDQVSVLKSFDFIDELLQSINKRMIPVPFTFDFKLFSKGIKSVLELDSAFSIGKVLLLLYNHYKIFPVEFRVQMAIYLLTNAFFKLFLHWSLNVRAIFHHLLYIRLYNEASQPLQMLDQKDQEVYKMHPQYRNQIVSRHRKLMVILENAESIAINQKHQSNIFTYDKDLHKKLKKKLMEKRRQRKYPNQIYQSEVIRKVKSSTKIEFEREFMFQLAKPKLQRYNSELLNSNLKIVLENATIRGQDEVIRVKKSSKKEESQKQIRMQKKQQETKRKRRLSIFQKDFQSELVPLKKEQMCYVSSSLGQYQKVNQVFIKHAQKHPKSVPVVRLEMNLDERQLRPQGFDADEW